MPALDMTAEIAYVRPAKFEDAAICGRICYEAFAAINAQHNYDPEIPSAEAATELLSMLFGNPGFYTLVAEEDGRIVGSNCLDERSSIAGVGPITVDPTAQNHGIGRMLMEGVLDRAEESGFAGVRLVQSAFHARSLSLYAKLGFQVREPLALMRGRTLGITMDGYSIRRATIDDLGACNRVCSQIHGHDRSGELQDAINDGTAVIAGRRGRIRGYSTMVGFFGHVVGETTQDVQALIAAAPELASPGILVPIRNAELFRWCLETGLRVVQPMNLMTSGLYNEPDGAYLASILY
jgi:GNAT superfamily N-acetyltransferase